MPKFYNSAEDDRRFALEGQEARGITLPSRKRQGKDVGGCTCRADDGTRKVCELPSALLPQRGDWLHLTELQRIRVGSSCGSCACGSSGSSKSLQNMRTCFNRQSSRAAPHWTLSPKFTRSPTSRWLFLPPCSAVKTRQEAQRCQWSSMSCYSRGSVQAHCEPISPIDTAVDSSAIKNSRALTT